MENRKLSKKVPIALVVGWLGLIVLLYMAIVTYSVLEPETYIRLVKASWPVMLLSVVSCGISALFMAAITVLAKKAEIKWLHIVSMIHLFAYVGIGFLTAIPLLLFYLS